MNILMMLYTKIASLPHYQKNDEVLKILYTEFQSVCVPNAIRMVTKTLASEANTTGDANQSSDAEFLASRISI